MKKNWAKAKPPQSFLARRSVVYPGLEPLVGDNNKENIRGETERVNTHLKVQEIIKFRNKTTGTDYTVFKAVEMA